MSPRTSVTVECYSGYTFAERPIAFVWEGHRYEIQRILQRWRSPDGPGFWVLTVDGTQFELTYNQARDEWSLDLLPGRRAHSPPAVPVAPDSQGAGGRAGGSEEGPRADTPDRKENKIDA